MNEKEALEKALTEWLKAEIDYISRRNIALMADIVYSAQGYVTGGGELDEVSDLVLFRCLETMLTEGNWRVVIGPQE